MALIRWEPVRELSTIQNEMNRLFNTFFEAPAAGGGAVTSARRWVPAMDLVESEDEFVLRADLPGLSEEDVNIELEDNVLTISGERKSEHEQRKEGYYRVERASGSFARSLTLPEGVDPEKVRAQFDRGVLEVRIPKPEQRKPRKVTISAGAGAAKTIEGSETSQAGAEPTAGVQVSADSHEPAGAAA
jgi:HSP20 family protein